MMPMPSFYTSPYFVNEPDNWHLTDDAPEDVRKEFEEYMSMAKQDNYKKERTETALSFHFSDFGMRGYISMVKPSGLFLRFSFSF